MKMVICFDTEDEKGMENSIKMMDHLAKEYMNRRAVSNSEVAFGKIEFIKVLRMFASDIAEQLNEEGEEALNEGATTRQREEWEGLRFAKQFADKVYEAKSGGKRITTRLK